ncbi:MAG: amidohydrolase family protein [Pseudomonadota bacterium]
MNPPLVDAHAHIYSANMPVSSSAWFRPGQAFTAEQYLAVLDAHGIQFGVIAGISIFGYYNDYMIQQLRKHRRLRGTAIVPPTTDLYTLERMKADGVVGVRLQLTRQELPDLAGDDYRLLFRRIADLGMHIEVVVEGPRWPQVLPILESSGANIVIDHFAHPDPQAGIDCTGFQAVLRSVQRGKTWVKLSAPFRLTWAAPGQGRDPQSLTLAHQAAQCLLHNAGVERLVWGSDCPFIGHESSVTYADMLDELNQWVPDAQVRRKLSDTALKLYFS